MINEFLLLLTAAVVFVPLFQRLGLGSVLGYLTAGVVLGPSVLGLVEHINELRHLADLGVVFLLFVIGLELKPARLWTMRRTVFGLGLLQLVFTGAVLSVGAHWVGLAPRVSILVGFGLALSSTAFVLQLLAEHHSLGSAEGKAALGVLLLQDLAVVPLLILVSVFAPRAGEVGVNVGLGVLEGLGVLVLVVLAGRYAVRPLLRHIAAAGNSEVFAATVLLIALGTGWLTARVGLSMALGAFLAGVLLSDSEFRHQITADVDHARGLLLGLFFMTVGMGIDLSVLASQPAEIAGLVVALLLTKTLLLYPLARSFRLDTIKARRLALYLAQAGEFGFVLFGQALAVGLLEPAQHALLVVAASGSMVLTPALFALAAWLSARAPAVLLPDEARADHAHSAAGSVLISGFGRFGYRVGKVLESSRIPFVAVDNDPRRVLRAREEGLPVYYGDAARPDVLRHLGAARAALAVVTLDQTVAAERAVHTLKRQCPNVPIYARSRSGEDSLRLLSQGAETAVPEALESSLQLAASVLRRLGVEERRVDELVQRFREQDYSRLREAAPHAPPAGREAPPG